jgi:hypothetical protein
MRTKILHITIQSVQQLAATCTVYDNPKLYHYALLLVLKLLKMATSVRALLDTVVQALPEVGNLALLFFLLFYIFAALGVELFGRVG